MLESLVTKLKATNFIKNDTPAQTFSSEICEIFKNTYIQKYLLLAVSYFPNPVYPFFFFLSTEYELSFFFKRATLFDQMLPYQLCIRKKYFFNISINILIKILLKICAGLKVLFYTW